MATVMLRPARARLPGYLSLAVAISTVAMPIGSAVASRVGRAHEASKRCSGITWRTLRDGSEVCPVNHGLIADVRLVRLRWSSWGAPVARATGFSAHTVYPNNRCCAFALTPATVRLSQPRSCPDGVRIYSRFQLTVYTRDKSRVTMRLAYPIPCNGITGGGNG